MWKSWQPKEKKKAEEPLLHEHEWEIIEKIEATCTEDGKITYKCKVPECEEEKTEVITGTKNKYNTPTGTYKIRSKRRNIYLIGPTWRKKVQYWMAFIGIEYGFHDVGWRDEKDFDDSSTYINNGSFGCVNMRTDDVAELYSNIAKGTKVIIRK